MFNANNFAKAALVKEHLFCIENIKFSILFYFSSVRTPGFNLTKVAIGKLKLFYLIVNFLEYLTVNS